jgi:hypothetical protein
MNHGQSPLAFASQEFSKNSVVPGSAAASAVGVRAQQIKPKAIKAINFTAVPFSLAA